MQYRHWIITPTTKQPICVKKYAAVIVENGIVLLEQCFITISCTMTEPTFTFNWNQPTSWFTNIDIIIGDSSNKTNN